MSCVRTDKRTFSPLNDRELSMQTRNQEKYKILHANTERLKNSTVPYIQRMLNNIEEKRS